MTNKVKRARTHRALRKNQTKALLYITGWRVADLFFVCVVYANFDIITKVGFEAEHIKRYHLDVFFL